MDLNQFVSKWQPVVLPERSAAQQHFIDLCALLGQVPPAQADPTGDWYTFEKRVNKIGGDEKGFADVWKRDYFAWEYKGKKKNLSAAYIQLSAYHEDLGNPPLLVVCDLNRFEVHLKVTNTEKRIFTFDLDDLLANSPTLSCPIVPIEVLHAVMENPKALYPEKTAEQVTQEIGREFGGIARNLIQRGNDPSRVARFLIRLLFCLFSEDIGLLESGMFTKTIEQFKDKPEYFSQSISSLFRAMAIGGPFGTTLIRRFNGGLFTDDSALELTTGDLTTLLMLARKDWKGIEPSIFGTIFERSLDPAKRSQLGAHYTSRTDIEAIVEPVLLPPLLREWKAVQGQAAPIIEHKRIIQAEQKPDTTHVEKARARRAIATADTQLADLLRAFTEKISSIRVLDPACGSGNFLYVSLRYLLDLEHEVIQFAYRNGLTGFFPQVGPEQMRGIELNEYAHELAPVTIWIGYLQWMRENGYSSGIQEPILRRTDMVEHRDALITVAEDGTATEAIWPDAEFIVGNPPFLGDKKIRAELGEEYRDHLRLVFRDRVSGGADLVTYWFEKARALVASRKTQRIGLLSTNSIRTGKSRQVLDAIKMTGDIFFGISDRKWILDGAAVRVSLIGFDDGTETNRILDGASVTNINADLSGNRIDVSSVPPLSENKGIVFLGIMKAGKFDIPDTVAQEMLIAPMNVNGRPNSDVIKHRLGGQDVTGRDRGGFLIDFVEMSEEEASLYEKPFEYVKEYIKPERDGNRDDFLRTNWWRHGRSRPALRSAMQGKTRSIVTPEVAKHRVFIWMSQDTVPDHKLHVFARDDDYFFGVLHSRVHETWTLALCSWMGVGNDPVYASSRTFGTFPMPWSPGKEPNDDPILQAIASAATHLVMLRDRWLHPVSTNAEHFRSGASDAERETRTLTNLYNARPTWLDTAHKKLDEAVFAAYGWPTDLADEEILVRLLKLNQQRAVGNRGHDMG